MRPVNRVLVYRVGSLGDTVVSLPALRRVARAYPEAKRWALTNLSVHLRATPVAAVLENTGLIEGYIEYPLHTRRPSTLLRLRQKIRRFNPDVLIYLAAPRGRLKAFRDAAFFHACGIRQLTGVPYTHEMQAPLPVSRNEYEHEASRLVRCLGSIGRGAVAVDDFDLELTASERASARTALAPLNPNAGVLAISIGAKIDVKDWGDRNWSALLSRLSGELPGWKLVLVGATAERSRSESLSKCWRGPSINLCGQLTVRQSAAALETAAIFVGHDSGPMHLAAAVQTPTVAIFSSRNLRGQWYPFGERHRVLYHSVPCEGCGLSVCDERQKECIMSIGVDEVVAAVFDTLRGVGPLV